MSLCYVGHKDKIILISIPALLMQCLNDDFASFSDMCVCYDADNTTPCRKYCEPAFKHASIVTGIHK